MGVPSLFRYLIKRYPKTVTPAKEFRGDNIDINIPNPNKFENDHLYLDMNGIIHPCCHPESGPPPRNTDEMIIAIFAYIDRIVAIVRPRKLLYMAIDGVAPRAKMNQQRSRRFRAAQEAAEKAEKLIQARRESGLPDEDPDADHVFDSNVITPGTPFMADLAKALKYYIIKKCSTDGGWKDLKVILSDATVPGEGEHKIMDFIRLQRAQPGYNPNTQHVLYGLDADLIFLGLSTHEPHFRVLREDVMAAERQKYRNDKYGDSRQDDRPKPYIFFHINILREYLTIDLAPTQRLRFEWDIERAIDDWIFICYFVGNDFLPHMPSLEIREGAIDRLVLLWKEALPTFDGYVTHDGNCDINKVCQMMDALGLVEDAIFKERIKTNAKEEKRRQKKSDQENLPQLERFIPFELREPPVTNLSNMDSLALDTALSNLDLDFDPTAPVKAPSAGVDAQLALSQLLGISTSLPRNNLLNTALEPDPSVDDSDNPDKVVDEVRLGEEGWKDRYYQSKFGIDKDDILEKSRIVYAYIEGLCWVLKYYFHGCPSWKWFYPYHYAPFASDFGPAVKYYGKISIQFTLGQPFQPYEQLMGVFPAASAILDFYPEKFRVDLNGKKAEWQGVALLPFIDEERLLAAVRPHYHLLTPEEQLLNSFGTEIVFCSNRATLYQAAAHVYGKPNKSVRIPSHLNAGFSGQLSADPGVVPLGANIEGPLQRIQVPMVLDVSSLSFTFIPPPRPSQLYASILPGCRQPDRMLTGEDALHLQTDGAARRQTNGTNSAAIRMIAHSVGPMPLPSRPEPRSQTMRDAYSSAASSYTRYNAREPVNILQRPPGNPRQEIYHQSQPPHGSLASTTRNTPTMQDLFRSQSGRNNEQYHNHMQPPNISGTHMSGNIHIGEPAMTQHDSRSRAHNERPVHYQSNGHHHYPGSIGEPHFDSNSRPHSGQHSQSLLFPNGSAPPSHIMIGEPQLPKSERPKATIIPRPDLPMNAQNGKATHPVQIGEPALKRKEPFNPYLAHQDWSTSRPSSASKSTLTPQVQGLFEQHSGTHGYEKRRGIDHEQNRRKSFDPSKAFPRIDEAHTTSYGASGRGGRGGSHRGSTRGRGGHRAGGAHQEHSNVSGVPITLNTLLNVTSDVVSVPNSTAKTETTGGEKKATKKRKPRNKARKPDNEQNGATGPPNALDGANAAATTQPPISAPTKDAAALAATRARNLRRKQNKEAKKAEAQAGPKPAPNVIEANIAMP